MLGHYPASCAKSTLASGLRARVPGGTGTALPKDVMRGGRCRHLDPHVNLCFCFGFQLVLKIQEIFDSKRGKKRVKLLSPAGREAPPVKGMEGSSTILFAINLWSGTVPVRPGVLLAGWAPPPPAAHAGLTRQC